MGADQVINIYAEYGLMALIVLAFFLLLVWVLRTNKEREDKLYKIIDSLSEQLPEMRQALERIEKKLGV